VKSKSIAVDRKYYLKSLRTPLVNMFMPIVAQKYEAGGKMKADTKWYTDVAAKETERLLFDVTKRRPWRFDAALRKASIENSPLALAFSRGKKRPPTAGADADVDAKKKKPELH
jgi:hypothetical protein